MLNRKKFTYISIFRYRLCSRLEALLILSWKEVGIAEGLLSGRSIAFPLRSSPCLLSLQCISSCLRCQETVWRERETPRFRPFGPPRYRRKENWAENRRKEKETVLPGYRDKKMKIGSGHHDGTERMNLVGSNRDSANEARDHAA